MVYMSEHTIFYKGIPVTYTVQKDESFKSAIGAIAVLVAIASMTGTHETENITQLPFKSAILEYKGKTTNDLWLATIAIATEMKRLCDVNKNGVSWADIESAMSQHEIIESREPVRIASSSYVVTDETNWFKFDGSPDEDKVQDLERWIENFIVTNDHEVFEDTRMKDEVVDKLVRSVTGTGSSITLWNPLTIIHSKDVEKISVIDVGMIHLPTIEEPYFKVYRIRVDTIRTCSRWFFGESNKGIIFVEMYSKKYYPRTEIIDGIKFKSS
jgi:hypothetical protein